MRFSGSLAVLLNMACVVKLQCLYAQGTASTWPMFQRDARRTGQSTFTGPQSNNVKCSFPAPGGGVGTPVLAADGTIYLPAGIIPFSGSGTGNLVAINPDCTQKWSFTLPGPPAATAPGVGGDGTIYVHANGPQNTASVETLSAINPDGTSKWRFDFNGGMAIFTSTIQSSPAIASDGTIWIGSGDTNLYALNPDKSIKCAASPSFSTLTSSPAIAPDGTVYIVDFFDLFAYTSACKMKWKYRLTNITGEQATPSVGADGTIYVGSPDKNYYALNPDGTLKWKFLTGWNIIQSAPAIAADGTIYAASDKLYALNPDGTMKWSRACFGTGLSSTASPIIGADGTVYWEQAFNACAYDASGNLKWMSSINPSSSSNAVIAPSGALYMGIGGFGSPGTDPALVIFASPSLSISKTHSGNFKQGQQNGTYTVTVSNSGGSPTSGMVTVTDTLPTGFTLASMSGTGWSCSSNSCSRSDALNGGLSYPAITVAVNVAANAGSPLVNQATASGGGASTVNAMDSTIVNPNPPVLTISKTHSGNFTQGQQNATYTVTVSNTAGAGPTSGPVTVTDILPAGLALVSMGGTGWSCSANACGRTDALNGGASYPPITVTVNVNANATSPQTNQVITGGSPASASAGDTTTITGGAVTPPFGSFDTPLNNTNNVIGAIGVTGWALDAVGVTKVDLYRDPVSGETGGTYGLIFIGTANFVGGARPDVQASYPGYPNASRAGWGYQLLTNFLPNGGNGTFKLHAFAYNAAGGVAELTSVPGQPANTGRTITCTNSSAAKPFGTIDTPAQGGTVSGSGYVNFGWALTPPPGGTNKIPTDGSTITVYVDGAPLTGHPTYNNFRNDIATLFPGYTNTSGAVGYYVLDTTKLSNGPHSIAWVVFDNAMRGEGLGSRYFAASNGAATVTEPSDDGHVRAVRGAEHVEKSREFASDVVTVQQMERLELRLGAVHDGHLVFRGESRPLPAGSTLDPETGVFYWQILPPFLGDYDFEFTADEADAPPVRLKVRIVAQSFE